MNLEIKNSYHASMYYEIYRRKPKPSVALSLKRMDKNFVNYFLNYDSYTIKLKVICLENCPKKARWLWIPIMGLYLG